MNITVIVEHGETETFSLLDSEMASLQEAVNNTSIQFLFFERSGRKMMINKDHIIKIWWSV